ncbi:TPA: exotoxin, partial [Staphylococcus aureus]|nr:exotoxin [Staphylococcus aureus]
SSREFLKIYNDNKTIDAENFHLDVEISYEKTE